MFGNRKRQYPLADDHIEVVASCHMDSSEYTSTTPSILGTSFAIWILIPAQVYTYLHYSLQFIHCLFEFKFHFRISSKYNLFVFKQTMFTSTDSNLFMYTYLHYPVQGYLKFMHGFNFTTKLLLLHQLRKPTYMDGQFD